jgi:hypothetical protein
MGGPCSTNGEDRNEHMLLMGKLEEGRPRARPRRRWRITLRSILEREREWGGVNWIGMAQDKDK